MAGRAGQRARKRELVLFDDVDVTVVVERTVEGEKIPVPHIVRAANRKSPAQISREISGAGRHGTGLGCLDRQSDRRTGARMSTVVHGCCRSQGRRSKGSLEGGQGW